LESLKQTGTNLLQKMLGLVRKEANFAMHRAESDSLGSDTIEGFGTCVGANWGLQGAVTEVEGVLVLLERVLNILELHGHLTLLINDGGEGECPVLTEDTVLINKVHCDLHRLHVQSVYH